MYPMARGFLVSYFNVKNFKCNDFKIIVFFNIYVHSINWVTDICGLLNELPNYKTP